MVELSKNKYGDDYDDYDPDIDIDMGGKSKYKWRY
jgi:hypothetical protein